MSEALRYLRLAARTLRREGGHSALAVLTLALGIGATTALFTVVRATLLQSLPYRSPDELVHLWETRPQAAARQLSYPDFVDLRDDSRSFAGVAGYAYDGFIWQRPEGPRRLAGARVSANFFDVLGVALPLGRAFLADEDVAGGHRDALIVSDAFWREALGADPQAVGRSLVLDGEPFRVVGVLPPAFHFARLGQPDVYAPLAAPQARLERRYMHWMWGIARLRPGVALPQAKAELATLAARRALADPQWHQGTGLDAEALRDTFVGEVRPLVLGLFAATFVVLLISGANVAGMAIARSVTRRHDIAVRLALGASRRDLARQYLAESSLVALLGSALGLLGAHWGVRALVAAMPAAQLQRLPFLQHLELHPLVLAFSLASGLASACLFGALPALRAATETTANELRSGRRTLGGNRRLHAGLVIGEIGLAMLVLVAAGLFVRSVRHLMRVDPGFETADLLTASVVAPDGYATPAARVALFAGLDARLGALPRVAGVAWVDRLPLLGSGNTGTPTVLGRAPAETDDPSCELRVVSPSYFDVLGIPRVAGRSFEASDRAETTPVVVVNQAFARALFRGESPLGQHVSFVFMDGQPQLEIVGVVGDENVVALDRAAGPVLYFPFAQQTDTGMSLVLRTGGDPRRLAAAVRAATREIDPLLLVAGERTMQEIIAASPAAALRGYPAILLASFAGLALVLSGIGLYAVMSLTVAARRQEIGVRMALGATRGNLLRLVMGRGLVLSGAGVAIGLAVAAAGTRLLAPYLFAVSPWDPETLTLAAALLVGCGLLACFVPAWRAAGLSPSTAQRGETGG